MKIILILILITITTSLDACELHIAELMRLFATNKTKCIPSVTLVLQEVHGYVLYSGKMVDDLGLPYTCLKYPNYSYFTGEVAGIQDDVKYRAYLGVCFSSKCTVEDID